jgi:hypothetical protein
MFAMVALLTVGCAQPPSPDTISAARPSDSVSQEAPSTASLKPETLEMPETPQAAPIRVTIERLMGADETALHRLLGSPQFRRRDPPAQLLRYRAPICLLDLFLYPGNGGDHRVTHIEARGRDGKDRPAAKCLDSIVEAREKAETG